MYNVMEEVVHLIYYMAEGGCLAKFCASFMETRMGSRKGTALAVVLSYMIMRECRGLFSVADYENLSYESLRIIFGTIVSFLTLLIFLVGFYKAESRMGIFVILTFLAVRDIGYLLMYTVWQSSYSLLCDFGVWFLEKGRLTGDDLMDLVLAGGYGMIFLTYFSSLCILWAVLKKIVHSFQEKEYRMHRRELFFLLTPEMTGLLICILLRSIMFAMEQERPVLLYDKYPALILIVPLILLLSLLSIPHGVKVFQGLIDLNREKNGRIILENQINGMQGQIEEMEHIYEGIRCMKHDMQNTISIIMQLTAGIPEAAAGGDKCRHDGRMQSLQDYLAELGRSFDTLELRYRTGNAVVDTLLNMKYHEICRTMPELKLEADGLLFPDMMCIQSYDMGVILGNALDNAIEACRRLHEKDKEAALFIRLSSFRKGKMFFLEIENSFDGNMIQNTQSEFPKTSKADAGAHGLGFTNMKNAAGKYFGAVDWSVSGSVFTLAVMMQDEQRKEYEL